MSSLERMVIGAVAVVVIVGVVAVAALMLAGGRGSAVASPSPSDSVPTPSASADGESPSAAPSGSPADEDEALAVLAEIEEQVIAIRGLPAADIGPPELITRAELADELIRIFEADYPPEEQAADNAALRALGLLGDDEDVAELQLQLLGDSVLGFYDDDERRMVVVTDAGLTPNARLTYAHEYTHALQDAAFGLDDVNAGAEDADDASLARTALIEGDATVTMLAWALENLTQAELVEVFEQQELPDTTGIPSWMVSQLEFPYNEGSLWAGALAGNPLSPQFGAIDAAYNDPPDSTEQILHLDAWDPREEPAAVSEVDLAAAMGDGWEEVDDTPLGEAITRMILEHHGVPRDDALAAAAGWGGDRLTVATDAGGGFAVAWRLTWDTPADADEFAEAYRQVLPSLPMPATVVDLADDEVLVAHAATDDLLRRAVEAAGG
jgi:hypothetical protein